MDGKVTIELEMVPEAEGMDHPFDYFNEELIEFFSNFGWKVTWTSYGGDVKAGEEGEDE
jgi:hypothetical protein